MVDRVILAIRKQIRPRDIRCRQGCIFWQIGVDEPADHGVVVPALQVVEAGFDVLVVAPIPQGVDVCEGAVVVRDLAAGVHRDGGFAPGVVAVGRDLDHVDRRAPSDGDGLVELCHVPLLVCQIIVGKAVAVLPVDHGQGLALGVVEEIKLVVDAVLVPLLPHDLAVLREVVVGNGLIPAGHCLACPDAVGVVGEGHALAGLACRSQLVAHLPCHTVFCTVIVRRRVAGGLTCGALFVSKSVAVISRQQVAPIGIAIGVGMGAGSVLGCQDIPGGIVGVARDSFVILRDLRQLLQLVIGIMLRILRRDAGRISRNAACAVVGIIVIGPGQALAPVGGILQPGDLRTGPVRGEVLELTTLAQSTCTNHPPQMSQVPHSAWRHSHPHFHGKAQENIAFVHLLVCLAWQIEN